MPCSREKQITGHSGETLAMNYLLGKGYQVLARNKHTPYGEIDLIAKEGEIVVFVEVKTRKSEAFGLPEEAITKEKYAHMVGAGQAYLQETCGQEPDWRIDVIAIRLKASPDDAEIVHFENVHV